MFYLKKVWQKVTNCLAAAMFWYGFGLNVIPVLPSTKRTAPKWDPWLNDLNDHKVYEYWSGHPNHEVGCIVGDDLIVFDADTTESLAALTVIENRFGLTPKLVVNTAKGQHHYYRRAPGTIARSDAHDSKKYTDRIDIKTGRGMVILPISTGKTLRILEAESKDDLSEVNQKFIDAIYEHNGRTAPSESVVIKPITHGEADETSLQKIKALLDKIEPDSGYEDWLHVGMSIFHETDGNDEGRALFDRWSSKGDKYKGLKEIESKWRSFRLDTPNPVTIRTLNKMAYDAEDFEVCECEIVTPNEEVNEKTVIPLEKYSLLGMSDEIEKQVKEDVYLLGETAILGQSTVYYGAPNSGKTLITISELINCIREGRIDPTNVYYINVDDTAKGLLEKLRIAEEYRFNMVAEGYKDFKASNFLSTIKEMTESDNAQDIIIILDTLKKFTDLMSKKLCTHFGKIIRRFVMKGGTVISLAHINKNPGQDGKPIHAGTTDIIEDADCAYVIDIIKEDTDRKVVEFTNRKNRGSVALSVAYSYSLEKDISYNELLLSIEKVEDIDLTTVKQEAEVKSDAEVIEAVKSCIQDGIKTKMKLAAAAAERANVSQKSALRNIEKYEGDDPAFHQWSFKVRDRGAKVYELLIRPSSDRSELPIDES